MKNNIATRGVLEGDFQQIISINLDLITHFYPSSCKHILPEKNNSNHLESLELSIAAFSGIHIAFGGVGSSDTIQVSAISCDSFKKIHPSKCFTTIKQ